MTDQRKPKRGRFVADGDTVILLHEDGRVECVDRGGRIERASTPPAPDQLAGYMVPETTHGTVPPTTADPFRIVDVTGGLSSEIWSRLAATVEVSAPSTDAVDRLRRRLEDATGEGVTVDAQVLGPGQVKAWVWFSYRADRRAAVDEILRPYGEGGTG